MTTVYFLRHGKTEFNRQQRFQGAVCDAPLLKQSIVDAQKAGAFLADKQISHVWVSPQKRAQTTAKQALSQWHTQPPIITVAGFAEMDFGRLDGKLFPEYEKTAAIQAFMHAPAAYDPSDFGGESYYDLAQRALGAFFAQVKSLPSEGNVLIVAHAITITTLVQMLLHNDVAKIRDRGLVANTSVTALNTNDFSEFALSFWNKIDFLGNNV